VSEFRDNGPFDDADQVIRQWASWSRGMQGLLSNREAARMLLLEALLIAGRQPTTFEKDYLEGIEIDPILSQILAGWLISAAHSELAARRTVPGPEAAPLELPER